MAATMDSKALSEAAEAIAKKEASTSYKVTKEASSEKATAEAIWTVWANIQNWPTWDLGLTKCTMPTTFAPGQTFELTPKTPPGVPARTLTTCLLVVEPNRCFVDSTDMPFGNIQVEHAITPLSNGGVKIAHTITGQIREEQRAAFEKSLWAKWNSPETGLSNSVANVIKQAEALTLAASASSASPAATIDTSALKKMKSG